MKCPGCPVAAEQTCLGSIHPPLCADVARGQPGRADQLRALAARPHPAPYEPTIIDPYDPYRPDQAGRSRALGGSTKLTIRCHANAWSGYGQHAAQIARQIERAGFAVEIESLDRDESFLPLDPWVAARLIDGVRPGPKLVTRAANSFADQDARDHVVLTMWESSRLDPAWVATLNQARAILVPSQWNHDLFRASGITIPLRVIPLGIDPAVYGPVRPPTSDVVRFGAAGRLAHGASRKGIEDVIRAFGLAFPGDEPVALEVKIWPDCLLAEPTDPRITLIRDPLPAATLATWYGSLDCFVSGSKSEGWGLQPHQAMAVGRPTIAIVAGGHAMYMTDATTWPVAYDVAPVPPDFPTYGGRGDWFVPRLDSLVARLREAYRDPAARLTKGAAAVRQANLSTWDAMGPGLVAALEEFGLLTRANQPADRAQLGMLVDLCRYGSGPCGCLGGPPRQCSYPERPALVRRDDCLACLGPPPGRP